MAKRFILRKCITVMMATLMCVCSSITVMASDDTVDSMLRSNSEIVIGVETEVDNITEDSLDFVIDDVSLEDNVKLLASMNGVNRPNNFLEMSEALEKLTGTTVRGNQLYGSLYSIWTSDSYNTVGGNHEMHIEHKDNPTYYEAMTNGLLLEIFDNNRDELSLIATKSFSDIDANAYYASYIPSSVYYGIINGTGNNQFSPSKELTRAEWIVMYAKAFNGADLSGKENSLAYKDAVNAGCPDWAASGYVASANYMLSIPFFSDTDNAFSKGITRIEVVNSIIEKLFGSDIADGSDYANRASQGASISPFSDIKTVISKTELENRANANSTTYDEERYKVLISDDGSIDEQSYRCLLLASDLGLIKGMGNGESGYSQVLTRGQAVVFLENMARLGSPYK